MKHKNEWITLEPFCTECGKLIGEREATVILSGNGYCSNECMSVHFNKVMVSQEGSDPSIS